MQNFENKKIPTNLDSLIEHPYTKYIAIGIGIVVVVYISGKTMTVVTQSIYSFKSMRKAIQS